MKQYWVRNRDKVTQHVGGLFKVPMMLRRAAISWKLSMAYDGLKG